MADLPTPWRLVPRLLLRRAGFGFGLLDGLADPGTVRSAERYRTAVTELENLREGLLTEAIPAAVTACRDRGDQAALRVLSKARAAIGRRRELPAMLGQAQPGQAQPGQAQSGQVRLEDYRAAHAEMRAAEAALRDAAGQDLGQCLARLRKLVDATMLDALLQLAPSFYDGVVRWLADEPAGGSTTARDRAMARRLYLYVQRLAAKNETTSFFGPLVHGVIDAPACAAPAGPNAIGDVSVGPETGSGVTGTEAFVAYWAVCELARRLASDPAVRGRIPVTMVPACRVDGQLLTLADGRQCRLTSEQAQLLAAVDGHRSPAALVTVTGLPPEQVSEWITGFERLGVIRTWPEPPSTAVQPIGQLLADAHTYAADTRWPARLATMRTLAQDFAAATGHDERRIALTALELEFTAVTNADPRRAGGRMYADRLVAYLDSGGDLSPVRLGAGLAGSVERELAPVLDIGACLGELRHRAHQELAGAVLREAAVRRMRYDEFIRRMSRSVAAGALDAYLAPAEEFTAALTILVRSRTTGSCCLLDPADLRGLGVPGASPRFASPDLLIRQGTDGPVFVLGEVHPYVYAWGSQELFCPDPDGLRETFAADLSPWGGASALATVLRRRRHKGLVTESFPGLFIEVTAVATRSRERTVAIADLFVEARDDRVVLRHGHSDLVLYAGEDDHPHLMAFAPPPVARFPLVWLGDRAPRITVGSLIAQRAGWLLDAEDLTGRGTAAFSSVQRIRALRGLPRWVYAHVPGETKPLCVDLDSPLAVDALASVVRAGAPGPVTVREMLPEPQALWLRRAGQFVTSELRLAMIRSGS